MTYDRFEDRPDWQVTPPFPPAALAPRSMRARYTVRVQQHRQGVEGATANRPHALLRTVRGPAGVVRPMLRLVVRCPVIKNFHCQILDLNSLAESCCRQLRAWGDHRQNSDIKSQHHLNKSVRYQAAQKKPARDSPKTLLANWPPSHRVHREQEERESEI